MAQERIGKYVVVRKLGEGGMRVFLARHAQTRRQVAIKVLPPQHTRNEETIRASARPCASSAVTSPSTKKHRRSRRRAPSY